VQGPNPALAFDELTEEEELLVLYGDDAEFEKAAGETPLPDGEGVMVRAAE
jgi:hypothetical protein